MKETWTITNEFLDKSKKLNRITSLKDVNVEIQGKRDIANTFSSYFCSVGEKFAENMDESTNTRVRGDYKGIMGNLNFHSRKKAISM